jgi:DNA-binding XRE family transcriptional regulator
MRERRRELELSERQLGLRAKCTQQTVHGVETGRHGMSIALAGRIAEGLDWTVGELLAPTPDPES